MKGNITLTMIKPTAVNKGHIGPILTRIVDAGFRIVAMKFLKMSQEQARAFYSVHNGKPFYESLIEFMSSGPIVAAILEKEDAVEEYRKLIGPTNPANAEAGTIRYDFGSNLQANAVHGSDSDENAIIEADFFFSRLERF
jgi:nucleoside-diphosphate kinase